MEIVPDAIAVPKSKLGLILGLTFGGLVLVGIGAFFYLRYLRK